MWTYAEYLALIRTLPGGLPHALRMRFAREVATAVDDYLAERDAGWTPGKADGRAVAQAQDLALVRQALAAEEHGNKPPPVSQLSPAMRQRIRSLPISSEDKARFGAGLAIMGMRSVTESKGRGKVRVRTNIRLLGEFERGRPADEAFKLMLWRIGWAWSRTTGQPPTSRHDGDSSDNPSPIAKAFSVVKELRPSALSLSPQAAAQALGSIRAGVA